MKYFSIFLFILLTSGCAGGHYYVRGDDPNRTMKVLYNDDSLWLSIIAMNGSNSSLMFSSKANDRDISVLVESISFTVQADREYIEPVTSTFSPKSITLTKGTMYSMTENFEFLTPPKTITARIQLKAITDGQEISIDETINLNIVEYGFWGALMSI